MKQGHCYLMTNNPLLLEFDNLPDKLELIYHECSIVELFEKLRDKVHQGARLLSHPLSGSVKPGETAYKSVLFELDLGEIELSARTLDLRSLQLVEQAFEACKKFHFKTELFDEASLKDFQMVDASLIQSALDSAQI